MSKINKLALLPFFLSCLFLSMATYMFYTAHNIMHAYEPLIEISKDVKLEVTQAYLRFGEVTLKANAKTQGIKMAWHHLNLAEWYAQAILKERDKGHQHSIVLDHPFLNKKIQRLGYSLAQFHKMAQQHSQVTNQKSPASSARQFNQLFNILINDISQLESLLYDRYQEALIRYQAAGITLFFIIILLIFLIITLLFKSRYKSRKLSARIAIGKQTIEENNKKLQTMAHYDFLTNLPNRLLLTSLLEIAISKAQKKEQYLMLLFIDLDHFKSINDFFGRSAGDKLLQLVADRLSHLVTPKDCVARFSGDEFTLLLAAEESEQQALNVASQTAKKIQRCLAEKIYIEETEYSIAASIGIALYPRDGDSAENLLKNADLSMHDVKQMGKNNYRFFSAELEHSTQRQFDLEKDLRKAIQMDELELYYQPQWSFKSGQLSGFEALVRWNHPQKGMIFPDKFMSIAESSQLIYQLDMWALEAVCKQLQQWDTNGIISQRVAINMSAVQFSSPNIIQKLARLLAKYKIKPNRIEIEIVESILMEDSEYTQMTLTALKKLGVPIAIDDFGTGYSSMAYLSKFPIDVLKIDKAFVMEISTSVAAKVIIESIIKMATKLDMSIVAEGIETAEQNNFLATQGCTFAQGYFYNKPLPAHDASLLLQEKR